MNTPSPPLLPVAEALARILATAQTPLETEYVPLAAALTIWTRQVVVPAARAAGSRATAITDFGSYNCRTIAGSDRPSEHATANAVDVSGVRLAGGATVAIARDWRDPGPRGVVARRLRDGACRLFAVTLSPDDNAAHHDHLHLDMGRGRVCG